MESATLTQSNPSPVANSKPVILIVDDDQDILNYVGSTLRRNGYTVFSAHCAVFAMAVFRRHASEIQLLLTDVGLPDFNGPELADKLLLLNPELSVVYMSGMRSPELESLGYLKKPFTPTELLKAVQSHGSAAAA